MKTNGLLHLLKFPYEILGPTVNLLINLLIDLFSEKVLLDLDLTRGDPGRFVSSNRCLKLLLMMNWIAHWKALVALQTPL